MKDFYEAVEELAQSIEGKKPEIWCDDNSFDALDNGFHYMQDDLGTWDDTFEYVRELNGLSVVAFCWEEEPKKEDLGTILPVLTKEDPEHLYHKGTNDVFRWKTSFEGYKCKIIKCRTIENYKYSYWFIVGFES